MTFWSWFMDSMISFHHGVLLHEFTRIRHILNTNIDKFKGKLEKLLFAWYCNVAPQLVTVRLPV